MARLGSDSRAEAHQHGRFALIRYSICVTHKNDGRTLKASLDSLLCQIDDEFEVIIVDSKSSDGSHQVLRRLESEGKIRLFVKNCSRGAGRQLASSTP
jgi:glycosyltransferase involved in cell wall biosynthesis